MTTVYLYGLAGADQSYRVIRYTPVGIDNGRGLARDYKNAWTKNTIESHAIFKDILERERV